MIDKQLFKLIGNNKKYIFLTVGLMIISSLANILITASICYAIYLTISNTSIFNYIYPAITTIICILIRYITTNKVGYIRNMIGEKIKKDLREKTYNKILKLGEKETKDMSLAGLTQVSMEGIEQLDLYYSMYLPQFFFSLISPVILFLICVGIDWRVACVLLLCVPLIPLSIVMVSKYAKRIFNKYWGKYTSMGDSFLDSIQGLKELKIFEADEKQHEYINKSAEEFRKITMKVLVMQLVSITIMDLVAFTGAAIGIAFALNSAINHTNPILALFLILVAVEFFLPLRALGSAFHIAMNGASAGKKIITILNLEVPKWGKEKVENTNIELKDIEFSYDGHRKVLNNINMKFNNIGMHAIVGKSGCGKSTIVG